MSFLLEIDGWQKNIVFSSAHLLFGHDKCGFLHGHSYAIHVKVYGNKNKDGLVIDFSILKSHLKEIADSLDHRLLLPADNVYLDKNSNDIIIKLNQKKYILPKVDCILLPIKSVTAENLANYILNQLVEKIEITENIKKIIIGLDEGFGQGVSVEKIVG